MRILLASNYFHPEHTGGIETVAYNLVTRYRDAGHEVRWLAADCGESPHLGGPDDVPLRAFNFTERRFGVPYPVPSPGALKRLRGVADWCDVLHLHDCLYATNIALFLLSRRLGKPVLLTQQIGMVPYRSPVLRWILGRAYHTVGRRMLSSVEQVTFVSPLIRQWFATFTDCATPPLICLNGVDVGLFRPAAAEEREATRSRLGIDPGQPLLLFVGRFVEKKGLRLLRPLAEQRSDWCWLFVGRDDGNSPAGWNLSNVRVMPPVTQAELRDLYVAADLLVLPSVGEGLPLAALESLACGTPVLTTEETAGNAGELAPLLHGAAPSSDAIWAATERILPSSSTAAGRGLLAAEASRHCSWDSIAGKYLELLETLVENRQPAPTS